jgi:hypothetical protein
VQRQRQLYKNTYVTPHARKSFGQLDEEEKNKLEAIEFEWEVPEELKGPPPVVWDEAYEALQKYVSRYKNTKVPEQTFFGGTLMIFV